MGGFIPEEILEDIRSRVDIVEVISDYVQLKKKGQNFVGPCPFHREKDPSFTVSFEKQIFYCFGCTAGGNVFKFLMLHEGLTFQEAVENLARRVGVSLPARGKSQARRPRGADVARKVNSLAGAFYRQVLTRWEEAVPAREYLQKRGISPETAEQFELGYAPGSWGSLVKYLAEKGFNADILVKVGLAARGKKGAYDRFRSRIIFPIHDTGDNVVGFGGRILGRGEPKYLNTPETDFFNKRRVLYGLNQSRRYIREEGHAVIMEGYMDVIAAHRNGVKNAVASLGTSLTREQVQLLMRYTRDVIIAYDADVAGVAATLRGLDLAQELGCRVRVVTIPEGKDPDEFLSARGADGWYQLLSGAEPLLEYKLRQVKSGSKTGVQDKSAVLKEVLPNLANINDEVERAEAINLLATRLHTSWDAVAGEYQRFVEQERKKRPNSDKTAKTKHNIKHESLHLDARTKAEKVILRLILENPRLVSTVQRELEENFFRHPVLNRVYQKAVPLLQGPDFRPATVFDLLADDEQKMVSNLLMEDMPDGEPKQVLSTYVGAMQGFLKKERRERLLDILVEAEKSGDHKLVNETLGKLQALF